MSMDQKRLERLYAAGARYAVVVDAGTLFERVDDVYCRYLDAVEDCKLLGDGADVMAVTRRGELTTEF
jgi:hypothetical protein